MSPTEDCPASSVAAVPGAAAALAPVVPGRVPIFVMIPLDWLADDGSALRNPDALREQLMALKTAGVRGVMADMWWGLCEPRPMEYCFDGALALCALLEELGLKLQATMAFHKCGGNIGDAVTFPLPLWAIEPARENGLLYKSRQAVVSEDCLSLSADKVQMFPALDSNPEAKRTALDCYGDYIAAFVAHCSEHLGTTIVEIQVGMGPCGELRYPSYMLSNGWHYPGVGLVMAHDNGMLEMLAQATQMSEPPADLPEEQNAMPDSRPLFCTTKKGVEPLFRSGEGKVFLQWYSRVLREHGEAILQAAVGALSKQAVELERVELSVKVSGLHWHVAHPSRATEACAGYDCCSDIQADAYSEIAKMLASVAGESGRPVVFNFTCLEMDNKFCGMPDAFSAPEDLIAQVRRACITHGVPLAGENAAGFDLVTGDWAFAQMNKQLRGWSVGTDRMHTLTLLRLSEEFVAPDSLAQLGKFVAST